jgi:hypothetical protein
MCRHIENVTKFCVLPTELMFVFCVDLRTNCDYFTWSVINWLVFIFEKENVYCAVRAESLNLMRVNFYHQRLAVGFTSATEVVAIIYYVKGNELHRSTARNRKLFLVSKFQYPWPIPLLIQIGRNDAALQCNVNSNSRNDSRTQCFWIRFAYYQYYSIEDVPKIKI